MKKPWFSDYVVAGPAGRTVRTGRTSEFSTRATLVKVHKIDILITQVLTTKFTRCYFQAELFSMKWPWFSDYEVAGPAGPGAAGPGAAGRTGRTSEFSTRATLVKFLKINMLITQVFTTKIKMALFSG